MDVDVDVDLDVDAAPVAPRVAVVADERPEARVVARTRALAPRRARVIGRARRWPACGGFTLIEALVVLAMVAVLTLLALPSFSSAWLKARRSDAHAALLHLQRLQEGWRGEHRQYATAAELNAPATSPQGHYRLSIVSPTSSGYELRAEAVGGQRRDMPCLVLRLREQAGHTELLSDPAPGPSDHRRCWTQ